MIIKKFKRGVVLLSMILGIHFNSIAQAVQNKGLEVQMLQSDSSGTKIRVLVNNPEKKKVNLVVSNGWSDFFSSKSTTAPVFAINYDFSGADDGEYEIEVMAGKEKIIKKIAIRTEIQVSRLITFDNQVQKDSFGGNRSKLAF